MGVDFAKLAQSDSPGASTGASETLTLKRREGDIRRLLMKRQSRDSLARDMRYLSSSLLFPRLFDKVQMI